LLYFFDDYLLDTNRRELRCGCSAVDIEPQAFDLLEHLIRQRERVVSRDELIESIWGGRVVSESALSTRINAVRTAIGDSGVEQRLVKTLPRKGIRFVGQVREEQRAPEEASASKLESRTLETIELRPAQEAMSARQIIDGHSAALAPAMAAPLDPRRSFVPPVVMAAFVAIILAGFGVLTFSQLAQSTQSERARANVETAARLTHLAGQIDMTSREDYQAGREVAQWAVELDPQNATALARLAFAMVAGVLNHWSGDVVADLHAADLAVQDAARIAPESRIVRGAQCHILRAMRQFEAAIKRCGEFAQSFPNYSFFHKEIGYDELMLGRLDEALAEFREADRIAPDSRLRWSWIQGIGLIYLMQGQNQKAIDQLSRAALEAPNAGHSVAYLAAAYALVGREQEARDALDHYMKLWPNTSLSNFGPMVGTAAFNTKMERVRQGLRLAGLAE
jgi:DNA-binding winged helix-turn-helix (wHTH) protein/tetratricopeptide (TPR) repeat protein